MIDLTGLTVDELTQLEADVKAEIVCRDNLARIPRTITDLSRAYAASGGDPADRIPALTPAEEEALDA